MTNSFTERMKRLREHLQEALAIEHSTIPPYFTAWLSIQPGTNREAADILRTVMLEEMLHMTLVANILNAVGGQPVLTAPGFVPRYPHTLPYSSDKFKISIERFSRNAVRTFMKIELPTKASAKPKADGYQTLGQFYAFIRSEIEQLCRRFGEKEVFSGDPSRQVPAGAYYGTGKYFVVKNKESALDALREVVSEGEGSGQSVFDDDPPISGRGREPAHYYRFEQILKGRCYAERDTPRTGPRGDKLAVDFDSVYPIQANARMEDYPDGSPVRAALEDFSAAYGRLLAALEDAFNGQAARMNEAMAAMFQVENLGRALLRTPSGKTDGSSVGLCFEQVTIARAAIHRSEDAHIDHVIATHADAFRKAGVLSVRPGWKISGGWPTGERAIVATVERKRAAVPAPARVPAQVGPYVTDVREATPKQLARFRDPAAFATMKASESDPGREPEFPLERDAQTGARLKPAAEVAAEHSTVRRPAKPTVKYTPAPGASLAAVAANMTLTCQVSPDAGWATLKPFLSSVKNQLTVGMYDFTSAHVLETVLSGMAGSRKLALVLDHPTLNPTADQTDEDTEQRLSEALKARMNFAWAAAGDDPMVTSKIFPTSYHIKVAVKDQESFWLSSGNWNNSNQPDINPFASGRQPDLDRIVQASDRDWHVVVEHAGLAKTFDAYLRHDLQAASQLQDHDPLKDVRTLDPEPKADGKVPKKFFRARTFNNVAVTIQPLLTPDTGDGDYADHIAALIRSARKTVYVQTQYLHPPADGDAQVAPFRGILEALTAKINAGLDVRVIFSQWETESWLEKVQSAGIPARVVKIQQGVHNKGIVVDSTVVALGSQNWSTDGALFNRDASLIIHNAAVAAYYQEVFLHDWENMAEQKTPRFERPAEAAAGSGR